MGVSTCHKSICTQRACLSFTCAVPGGLGKARVPPCQDREKKQETRAGPGPPRQHQNVGCSSTWWTASPPSQVSPSPFGHHTETKRPQLMALPSLSLMRKQQPRPRAWDAPGLRNAEAASTCGCARCRTCTVASAHAHSVGREHQESWCSASCAPTTCPWRAECPMCLQQRLNKGSRLSARRKQSWIFQLLPAREVWKQLGPRNQGSWAQHLAST